MAPIGCSVQGCYKPSISAVQFSSVTQSCPEPMDCSTPGFPVHRQLLEFKLMSIESVIPSNLLILCHSLLFLPSIFPSIRVFSNESALCIRRPKYWSAELFYASSKWSNYWSFSFSISPSNKYSRLIFFMMDWLDLLKAQGTFKSLLRSSKHQFFSFLCSLTLTSICDYWKNHSFD